MYQIDKNFQLRDPEKDLDSGRVIMTSHIAYNSTESSIALLEKVAQSAVSVLKGELPANVVNKKELCR